MHVGFAVNAVRRRALLPTTLAARGTGWHMLFLRLAVVLDACGVLHAVTQNRGSPVLLCGQAAMLALVSSLAVWLGQTACCGAALLCAALRPAGRTALLSRVL